MRIVEGSNVDLINPFPLSEVKRLVGWGHCFKSMFLVDGGPSGEQELMEYYKQLLPRCMTFGIIDKANKLGYKHEAPLIGCFIQEPPSTVTNSYVHVTSTRKAWGSGMVDEAAKLALTTIFTDQPALLRVSAAILSTNAPAKAFVKRLGFKQDGQFKNYVIQSGTPKAISHFAFMRDDLWGS